MSTKSGFTNKQEVSRRHPKIDGVRWSVFSTHMTKSEADDRANSLRKRHLHGGKARVREIPKTIRGAMGRWGVYTP